MFGGVGGVGGVTEYGERGGWGANEVDAWQEKVWQFRQLVDFQYVIAESYGQERRRI